jgi:hypothetical protein
VSRVRAFPPKGKCKQSWPSGREIQFEKFDIDSLLSSCEWILRNRPRSLRNLRAQHRAYRNRLIAGIERPA